VGDFKTIRYERTGGVAVITLDRPDRHNAINGTMSRELPEAWAKASGDPEVRVVVVTGAGDRSFCTGFDVGDIASGTATIGEARDRGTLASLRLTALQNRCWKPVVTAVNGMAAAGGLHFVADSDIVIAARTASFFDGHVAVGLIAGCEPIGLVRCMAVEPVLRMALAGGRERLGAERAFELGLVSEVADLPALRGRALELAEHIAKNSPTAMAATKRALWESLDRPLSDALASSWQIVERHRAHPDPREGALAFAEKRPPRWAPLVADDWE
jgi:enoyl-CoA hydratase/carnithine racemase